MQYGDSNTTEDDLLLELERILKWWCPQIGVLPVIIHLGFPLTKSLQRSAGYPPCIRKPPNGWAIVLGISRNAERVCRAASECAALEEVVDRRGDAPRHGLSESPHPRWLTPADATGASLEICGMSLEMNTIGFVVKGEQQLVQWGWNLDVKMTSRTSKEQPNRHFWHQEQAKNSLGNTTESYGILKQCGLNAQPGTYVLHRFAVCFFGVQPCSTISVICTDPVTGRCPRWCPPGSPTPSRWIVWQNEYEMGATWLTSGAFHIGNEGMGSKWSGWWLGHPSEKYESQLGWLATQY